MKWIRLIDWRVAVGALIGSAVWSLVLAPRLMSPPGNLGMRFPCTPRELIGANNGPSEVFVCSCGSDGDSWTCFHVSGNLTTETKGTDI
jgi:hypothetical protein